MTSLQEAFAFITLFTFSEGKRGLCLVLRDYVTRITSVEQVQQPLFLGKEGRKEGYTVCLDDFEQAATNRENRVARGETQGGVNCLTHALPRCLPTPNSMEADGNGYGGINHSPGGGVPCLGRRLE